MNAKSKGQSCNSKTQTLINSIPVHSPWHHISIDFIGSNVTRIQFWNVSDYFTKWVGMMMGLPRMITTDQGKEFNNSLNHKFMKKLNILATAYHPQVK